MTSVLAYHKVDDRFELGLTNVRPGSFLRQIEAVVANGYMLASDWWSPGSDKSVCLTFDDGYDCFRRNVVPLLSRLGASAAVFIITDFIGKTNSWDVKLSFRPFRHMDGEEIQEIVGLGFEVGSHSCTHRDLTRLSNDALKRELDESKKRLEDLTGTEVDAFSFPFGRHNRRTVEAAFDAGYRRLFGLGSASGEGVIPRLPVYRIDSPDSVLKKLDFDTMEIFKSDFIHSFANISALLSVRRGETRMSGTNRVSKSARSRDPGGNSGAT